MTNNVKSNGRTGFLRRRFTLIELLIVIAIISILAGMLVPSLFKARDTARAITCVNNLSQLSKALAMYLPDNNDWYALYDNSKGINTPDRKYLFNVGKTESLLLPYLPFLAGSNWIQGVDFIGSVRAKQMGPLACPSRRVGEDGVANSQTYSYGLNKRMQEEPNASKQSCTVAPSRSMYIGSKKAMTGGGVLYIDLSTGYPNYRPGFIHAGKGNFLMLDFHVETRSMSEVPDSTNYFQTTAKRQFWYHNFK